MAEIIRYLNNNGVKTALGNDFNKSSIRRILTNKKYIGIYSYNGKETTGGVPRIKKAPARAKAERELYLLTTKLFCGCCDSPMTGVCGTSKNKKVYQYYQCNKNRRGKCHLKSIKKYYLEDLVIKTVMNILTSDKIDKISQNICDFSENEAGKAVDIISAQIEKRQLEKQNLEAELAKEKILNPKLEFEQVKFFFERFRKGDINNIKFRRALIDTFINKIYVFKDKLHIFCNAQKSKIEVSISDSKCSPMERVVEMKRIELSTSRMRTVRSTD